MKPFIGAKLRILLERKKRADGVYPQVPRISSSIIAELGSSVSKSSQDSQAPGRKPRRAALGVQLCGSANWWHRLKRKRKCKPLPRDHDGSSIT